MNKPVLAFKGRLVTDFLINELFHVWTQDGSEHVANNMKQLLEAKDGPNWFV